MSGTINSTVQKTGEEVDKLVKPWVDTGVCSSESAYRALGLHRGRTYRNGYSVSEKFIDKGDGKGNTALIAAMSKCTPR